MCLSVSLCYSADRDGGGASTDTDHTPARLFQRFDQDKDGKGCEGTREMSGCVCMCMGKKLVQWKIFDWIFSSYRFTSMPGQLNEVEVAELLKQLTRVKQKKLSESGGANQDGTHDVMIDGEIMSVGESDFQLIFKQLSNLKETKVRQKRPNSHAPKHTDMNKL